MILKITKSNFRIDYSQIQYALKAITDTWPEIKDHIMFKQKRNNIAEQLQYALYVLGLHSRVNPLGYLHDIKSLQPDPIIPNDYMDLFKILAQFTLPGCWAEYQVDKSTEKYIIQFDSLLVPFEFKPIPTKVILETFVPDVPKPELKNEEKNSEVELDPIEEIKPIKPDKPVQKSKPPVSQDQKVKPTAKPKTNTKKAIKIKSNKKE